MDSLKSEIRNLKSSPSVAPVPGGGASEAREPLNLTSGPGGAGALPSSVAPAPGGGTSEAREPLNLTSGPGGAGAPPPSVAPASGGGASEAREPRNRAASAAARRIRDIPTELRPREELKRRGAAAMDLEKLLAIVMRNGLPGQNVTDLARELIVRAGGIEVLARMNHLDIQALKIPGVGEVKAMELEAAFEIGRRAASGAAIAAPRKISSSEDVFEIIEPLVRGKQQEFFYVLLLDAKNRLVGQPVHVATGSHDRCPASPTEIFSPVIKRGCTAAIVAHNHPSGDPTPSRDDIAITIRLVDAAKILGIRLLDHIVVGRRTDTHPDGFSSLSREKLVAF